MLAKSSKNMEVVKEKIKISDFVRSKQNNKRKKRKIFKCK